MVMEFAEQGSLDNVLVSAVEHDIVVSDQVLLTIAVQVGLRGPSTARRPCGPSC